MASAEGKTTEVKTTDTTAEPLCDGCEDDKATKYCVICPGALCDSCTQSHLKSKLTRDHTLCDLSLSRLGSTYIKSGEAPVGLSKCKIHQDNELDQFCEDCIRFICNDCMSDHLGHNTQSAKDDITVYRTVYREHMKNMTDGVHGLEQYRNTLMKIIQLYEDACARVDEKEDDFMKTVKENSKRLKGELRMVQGEFKQLLGDAENGLIKEIENADKSLAELQEVRKVGDIAVLSNALASSRDEMDHINDYKKKSTAKVTVPKADEVLPYFDNNAFKINEEMCIFFSMGIPTTNGTIENFKQLTSEHPISITNPESKNGYKFCTPSMMNHIVVVGENTTEIRVYDIKFKSNKIFNCKINEKIWQMIRVYHDKYVVIHHEAEALSLLNSHFDVLFTERFEKEVRAFCYLSPHRFMLCEQTGKSVYISTVSVKGKSFDKENEIIIKPTHGDKVWYMQLYPDKKYLCLATSTPRFLYKVNLSNSTFTKHDMSKIVVHSIWTLCVDGNGNILVGDTNGNIHKWDAQMNHDIVAKVDDAVRDVIVNGGRLIVSTTSNEIHVFS